MSKLTFFLENHDACDEGRDWALQTGCQTVAELWLRDDLRTEWRIWLACRTLPDNILRKFACRCVREIWHLLKDERSRNAVEVAERHADGLASDEELAIVRAAVSEAAWSAAWAEVSDAASAAAWSAAWAEVSDAASAAAWSAARAAARAAVSDAVWATARARQGEILMELVPTLEEVQP